MSSEMIERVARALQAVEPAQIGHKTGIELARAAIEAMREPTHRMLMAGALFDDREPNLDGYSRAKVNAKLSWCSMIDVALIGADDITANPLKITDRPTAGSIPFPAGSFRAEG